MAFRTRRRGLTLIELLIATALTLLIMGAVVTLFGNVGDAVTGSRATLEMAEQLRHAKELLRRDLQGITARGNVPLAPEQGLGYLEIVEGPMNDRTGQVPSSIFGDRDDMISFTTVRRGGEGRHALPLEVVWYCRFDDNPDGFGTLYRHIRVVTSSAANLNGYMQSVGASGEPNTLGDLTVRNNRTRAMIPSLPFNPEDVVLSNVLSFDVKVFDPEVRLLATSNIVTTPSDMNYSGTEAGRGAFVDLNHSQGVSRFSSGGNVYDTSALDYSNRSHFTNINNPYPGAPPYPHKLQGIEITLRVLEQTSRTVRQVTIREMVNP